MIHPDGEDFLYRPVLAHLIRVEQLEDGSLSLGDIVRLNEALDIKAENARRAQVWHDEHPGR